MLALYLETMGHQVLIEHSSRLAIVRAKLEKPDVCILDIGLPEMDGNELVRRLKVEQETANALFIAVTGTARSMTGEKPRQLGSAIIS
jgi:CheY-like chemotaxis protein